MDERLLDREYRYAWCFDIGEWEDIVEFIDLAICHEWKECTDVKKLIGECDFCEKSPRSKFDNEGIISGTLERD